MTYDYTASTPAQVRTIVDDAITAGEALLDGIVAVEGERTYANTVLPFDEIGAVAGDAYGRGPFLARVHPDAAVRDAASAENERLQRWLITLDSRTDLHEALLAYAETAEAGALEGVPARLLAHQLRDFRRAGTALPPAQREEVEALRARLSEVGIAFGRNVDEHSDALELTREELDGLPGSFIDRLSPGAAEGTHRVSLDYPELHPFLAQARRRDLRESLFRKSWSVAVEANRPLMEEALDIRARLAALLDADSWAQHAMDVRMADPAAVAAFYADLVPPLQARARREHAAIGALLEADEGDAVVQPWDTRYYDTQQRRRDFGIDQNEVAEHFPLAQVIEGMFSLTAEVFGLRYVHVEDARAWHPDVDLHQILDADSGAHIAHFYADLLPRANKYNHAAAFTLVPGRRRDGVEVRPVSAIVANFTPPSGDTPSLLTHTEVVTLFHEFGHILHQGLTTAEHVRFSGTSTERDFVEAPSQIMENWCWDVGVLQRFARHHATGEPIPQDLVDQLIAARDLNEGIAQLRQCFFGTLDLAIHTAARPGEDRDLDAMTRQAFAVTGLPYPDGTFFLSSFAHLMSGYDAGYYGYLWSRVYGDDMYSRFADEGVTSPSVGRAYRRTILEQGGTKDADVLLREFLGREPTNGPFLRKLGITDA